MQNRSNTKLAILSLFSCMALSSISSYAGPNTQTNLKNVTTTGKAVISGYLTYDQAKTYALHQARTKAVEQAAGITVNNISIIQDNLMLVDLVKTFSYGFIVNESREQWRGEWISGQEKPGYPVLEVSLTSTVKVLPKSFFKNYALTATLDKQVYTSGDSINIRISAKQPLYIVVANYTSKNNIIPIFPNSILDHNLIQADDTLNMPDDTADAKIIVKNYPGHQKDIEAFIILGFEKNPTTDAIPWNKLLVPGKEIKYADFFSKILELPITSIAEKTLVYTVLSRVP